ncbi:MAG: prolipoprotein diacylglyceryl transferase [Prevotellaceae bacterium]|jgi:prolipoprotein diacylglyceryl transferase|nr:prolipoprotein diacylglyceryl transferase [Prevotellaceae bacterium]
MANLFTVWENDPVIVEFLGFQLRYYGLCWALGIAAAMFVLRKVFEKEKLSTELLSSLFFYILIGVFVGARLGHCLFYTPLYYLSHPVEMLLPVSKNEFGAYYFSGYSGLASHGGAIGIVITALIFAKRKKQNLWDVFDKLALVAPLTGFFIRMGNFFNSEIIGKPTNFVFGIVFKSVDNAPRHPAQLYEAFSYLLIFIFLLYVYFRIKNKYKSGFTFGITILLIFFARFIIEYCKEVQEPFENHLKEILFVDMGQLLSLPFIIAGIIIIVLRNKISPNEKNKT